MNYIKISGDNVEIAGTVANPQMLKDGFFLYDRPIPEIGINQKLIFLGGAIKVAAQQAMIPKVITPRQARLILLQYGLLDEIELMIASDKALQIWWEYSLEIKRDDERLMLAATQLGLTSEQLDTMFTEAAIL